MPTEKNLYFLENGHNQDLLKREGRAGKGAISDYMKSFQTTTVDDSDISDCCILPVFG